MITSISRITIYVENQQEAEHFWVDTMGFVKVYEQPMKDSKWLEVAPRKEGTRFVLYEKALMKKQNPHADMSHPSLILSTLHLDQTHTTLKQRGVDIDDVMHMPYGSMCTFKDPDGNVYLLREDK